MKKTNKQAKRNIWRLLEFQLRTTFLDVDFECGKTFPLHFIKMKMFIIIAFSIMII